MGVDIAGLGLIFLAMLTGFVPGTIIGIWIVSHRNYVAWKKKKKQIRRQIEKSRKALDKAKRKDIAKQKKEFRKEQKRKRREAKQNSRLREPEEDPLMEDSYTEDNVTDTKEPSTPEQPDTGENRDSAGYRSAPDKSAVSETADRKPVWGFGRKKKKGTLLEKRIQTCISDMSFDCAENGTSEKDIAREYQKKQDDAYRI